MYEHYFILCIIFLRELNMTYITLTILPYYPIVSLSIFIGIYTISWKSDDLSLNIISTKYDKILSRHMLHVCSDALRFSASNF